MTEAAQAPVVMEQYWACPYCGKEIGERDTCCGEVGHAMEIDCPEAEAMREEVAKEHAFNNGPFGLGA